MKQSKSVQMVVTYCVHASLRSSVLWLLAVLFSLVSAPSYAESDVVAEANDMSQSIEISARGAPMSVFVKAVFANTELEVEISESLEGTVTGMYTGSIASVLETLSSEFDVTTHIEEGIVNVIPVSLAPQTQTQTQTPTKRTTRSIATLNEPVISNTQISNEKLTKKNQSDQKVVEATGRFEVDEVIERVFVLKNAIAIDTQMNNSSRSVVPGVLTQLNQIIEKLGVSSLTYVGKPVGGASESDRSVIALPSMNAIVVKDLASRMAVYKDVIESLDISNDSLKRAPELASEASTSTQESAAKWKIVQ